MALMAPVMPTLAKLITPYVSPPATNIALISVKAVTTLYVLELSIFLDLYKAECLGCRALANFLSPVSSRY